MHCMVAASIVDNIKIDCKGFVVVIPIQNVNVIRYV